MKCPSCGTMGMTRAVKRCRSCGEAYVAEDLLKLHQLQFLLDETAAWEGVDAQREAYVSRLERLRERMVPPKPAEPEVVAAEPAAEAVPIAPALEPALVKPVAVPAVEPAAAAALPAVEMVGGEVISA